jgi:NAD/NADP transhydrogenase alpha subunit
MPIPWGRAVGMKSEKLECKASSPLLEEAREEKEEAELLDFFVGLPETRQMAALVVGGFLVTAMMMLSFKNKQQNKVMRRRKKYLKKMKFNDIVHFVP